MSLVQVSGFHSRCHSYDSPLRFQPEPYLVSLKMCNNSEDYHSSVVYLFRSERHLKSSVPQPEYRPPM